MTVVDAQVVAVTVIRGKQMTGRDTDPMLEGRPVDGQRIDAVRQLHPDEIASLRPCHLGAGGEVVLDRTNRRGLLPAQRVAQ